MRWFIPVRAALAAGLAILLCAGPVLASEKGAPPAPPPVPVAGPPAADPLSQAMVKLVAAASVYGDLVSEGDELLGLVVDGASRAIDTENPPDRAWLTAWKAKVAAQSASLRAHRNALPPWPRDTFKAFGSDPRVRRMTEGMEQLPQTAAQSADGVLELADTIVPLVEAAIGGDDDSRIRLAGELLRGTIVALKAENVMLDITINTGVAEHPQTILSRTIRASNEALILLLEYTHDELNGEEVDPDALMAAVRAKLDLCRAEARKMGPTARLMSLRMQSEPLPEVLRARIVAALATYDDSGRVELQIADVLEKGIEALARDPDGESNILDEELGPLVDRRTALQAQRTAQFAQ
ncbi:hypothetical protein QO010_003235 [Caulobacter ginsengisoli]|uniref:Secreted protein n=1 Tax=Caulobacter ginsengisoli TaxID=400775 RepID=A0ABU0IWC0_9CAUL|nr:hypothetical protein [Caulobacter ginsengisoli]MDQ0465448.1 hypothetical protein [Caulobacter ginsengisoli]